MNARDLVKALLVPVREPTVFMVLVLFTVILTIGMSGGGARVSRADFQFAADLSLPDVDR